MPMRSSFVLVAILSLTGLALAQGPVREWEASPAQRQTILSLMRDERELLDAEDRVRKARATHDANVRACVAEIASSLGAASIAPDLRPDGRVIFREVAGVTSK